ncbi:Protein of unknown function [Gryllus bimaculatus]|nr:Protein of unknown function [Gryllus bimaculatus]
MSRPVAARARRRRRLLLLVLCEAAGAHPASPRPCLKASSPAAATGERPWTLAAAHATPAPSHAAAAAAPAPRQPRPPRAPPAANRSVVGSDAGRHVRKRTSKSEAAAQPAHHPAAFEGEGWGEGGGPHATPPARPLLPIRLGLLARRGRGAAEDYMLKLTSMLYLNGQASLP